MTKLQDDGGERLANGLGWFSIGMGLAQVIAPEKVAQLVGVRTAEGTCSVLRTCGYCEIAAGIGILYAQPLSRRKSRDRGGRVAASNDSGQVKKTLIINRPPDEVYRFWRDLEKLPSFMSNLESVRVTGERTSHWKAKGPAGSTFEWEAEITEDQPNSRIAWRSIGSSEVNNSGTVRFDRATGGRGTLLTVELQYAPPGGAISASVAKLFGSEPGQRVEQDLRLLKQILETGEIAKSDASIHEGMHMAQPPTSKELSSMPSRIGELVNS